MREPDSRTGTTKPSTKPGAPTNCTSQASTVLGLIRASPVVVRILEPTIRTKLAGT